MYLDLSKGKINLVLCPTDLRYGYNKLSLLAQTTLGINVAQGNDWVIFISTRRNIAKIIHSDDTGTLLITRRLHQGLFQWLTAPAEGAPVKNIDREKLIKYLNGEDIEVKRSSFIKN